MANHAEASPKHPDFLENIPGMKTLVDLAQARDQAEFQRQLNALDPLTIEMILHQRITDATFDRYALSLYETACRIREQIERYYIAHLVCDFKLCKLIPLFNCSFISLPDSEFLAKQRYTILRSLDLYDDLEKFKVSVFVLLIDCFKQSGDEGIIHFIKSYCSVPTSFDEFNTILLKHLRLDAKGLVSLFLCSDLLDPAVFFALSLHQQKKTILVLSDLWADLDAPMEFAQLFPAMQRLFDAAVQRNDVEMVLYLGFFSRFFYGNLHSSDKGWDKLDTTIEKPASDYFLRYCAEHVSGKSKNNQLQAQATEKNTIKKKIRIAYAYQRLVPSSVISVLYSLLKGHRLVNSGEFEFTVYSYSYNEKCGDFPQTVQQLKQMGVNVVLGSDLGNFDGFYYSHLDKAQALRKRILDDEIDIFVTTGSSMGNFLVSSRVAPTQIYWSHGDPYWSVHNVDYQIIHSSRREVVLDDYMGKPFHLFPWPMAEELLNPRVKASAINQLRSKYPDDSVILGYLGQMYKISNEEYLSTLRAILENNPQCIFLVCGHGDTQSIRNYFGNDECVARVYFLGPIEAHLYEHVIDIVLDSFPVPVGLVAQEMYEKSRPVVSLETPNNDMNRFRLAQTHAHTQQQYIEIAERLIRDPELRHSLGSQSKAFIRDKHNCRASATELEKFYRSITNRKV